MVRKGAYLEHLAGVPLFSRCSREELRRLARRTTDISVDAGHLLIREGRHGHEFFVVVDGRAEVTRGGKPVGKLGPGDFFGELALLEPGPRDATVRALTPMELIVITRAEFDAALEEAPAMTRKIMAGMTRRLRELDNRA